MADKLAYSTATGQSNKKEERKKASDYTPGKGPIKVRLETKGRGGKEVTILFDLPMTKPQAKALMRELQTRLACGATLKDSAIELRGDRRDKIKVYFEDRGETILFAGGRA